MKHPTLFSARLAAAATLMMIAPFATAGHPDVNWSITIGSPQPAPYVYAPPPVVYVQPQPVYVRPQPIYVQPATVIHYAPPYYVEEVRYKKVKHHQRKHRHHRDHDE